VRSQQANKQHGSKRLLFFDSSLTPWTSSIKP
jgi:hypothetical protein